MRQEGKQCPITKKYGLIRSDPRGLAREGGPSEPRVGDNIACHIAVISHDPGRPRFAGVRGTTGRGHISGPFGGRRTDISTTQIRRFLYAGAVNAAMSPPGKLSGRRPDRTDVRSGLVASALSREPRHSDERHGHNIHAGMSRVRNRVGWRDTVQGLLL